MMPASILRNHAKYDNLSRYGVGRALEFGSFHRAIIRQNILYARKHRLAGQ